MLIRRPADIPSSEITPESVFLGRRDFVRRAGQAAAAAALAPSALSACEGEPERVALADVEAVDQEALTPWEHVTTYNNFYEFGTGKDDPAKNSGEFEPRPWTVQVEGHCENPGTFDLDRIAPAAEVEERVYRLRCVEAWSMVIPWNGVPLRRVIERARPTSQAKFVAFQTVIRPAQMPGQRTRVLDWPYVEGLRMDEAMHDLTLLATGVYGKELPNQNGAPLRLVVPWKYGFKSIKSIVKISFVEEMPPTTWNIMAPHEYGFYANVNPTVDHPRWSQARERRITGGGLLSQLGRQQETRMFNGYGDQVAQLYTGMDLRRWY